MVLRKDFRSDQYAMSFQLGLGLSALCTPSVFPAIRQDIDAKTDLHAELRP